MFEGWSIGEVPDWVATAAVVAAGGYFLWRLWHGFFVMNLEVDITAARQPGVEGEDDLAINVKLVKGELGGTLTVHDAKVLIECPSDEIRLVAPLVETRRWSRLADPNDSAFQQLDLDRYAETLPRMRLPPGDAMSLCAYVRIPSPNVFIIHAVILGGGRGRLLQSLIPHAFRWRTKGLGQWHASIVSLPPPDLP